MRLPPIEIPDMALRAGLLYEVLRAVADQVPVINRALGRVGMEVDPEQPIAPVAEPNGAWRLDYASREIPMVKAPPERVAGPDEQEGRSPDKAP